MTATPYHIHTCNSPEEVAKALADNFTASAKQTTGLFTAGLAGGSTPALFLQTLGSQPYQEIIPWENIHFFWSDERCVQPDHPESNFGMAKHFLLDNIKIPDKNIHRIYGENDPVSEAQRYASEIKKWVPDDDSALPRFNWILLGLGSDGHTASLFPGAGILDEKKRICRVARHPLTQQKRITMTLPLINNARRIIFLATGENKARIVAEITGSKEPDKNLPASLILPWAGTLEYYLDDAAARLI